MKKILAIMFVALCLFGVSQPVSAANGKEAVLSGVKVAADEGGIKVERSVGAIIGGLINTILAAAGIVLVVIFVYAGVRYMTAAGDAEQAKKARSMMANAIIGLLIIIGSYALANFVVERLATAVTGTPTVQ